MNTNENNQTASTNFNFLTALEMSQILDIAMRAPSVHNTQPYKIKFLPPDKIEIYGDLSRHLKVGDPSFRDHLASIGAFCEGIRLGMQLKKIVCQIVYQDSPISAKIGANVPRVKIDGANSDIHLCATIKLIRQSTSPEIDSNDLELGNQMTKRTSFRGVFEPVDDRTFLNISTDLNALENIVIFSTKKDIARIDTIYAAETSKLNSEKRYVEELYCWLRLKRSHPRWSFDGLNSKAMSLKPLEAAIGQVLMKPQVLPILSKIGLGAMVTSESPQIRSSSFIVGMFQPHSINPMDTGKNFFHLWLHLAKYNIACCPLSAAVDSETGQRAILEMTGQSRPQWTSGRGRFMTLLRCGFIPEGLNYRSPRRTLGEILIEK